MGQALHLRGDLTRLVEVGKVGEEVFFGHQKLGGVEVGLALQLRVDLIIGEEVGKVAVVVIVCAAAIILGYAGKLDS